MISLTGMIGVLTELLTMFPKIIQWFRSPEWLEGPIFSRFLNDSDEKL